MTRFPIFAASTFVCSAVSPSGLGLEPSCISSWPLVSVSRTDRDLVVGQMILEQPCMVAIYKSHGCNNNFAH